MRSALATFFFLLIFISDVLHGQSPHFDQHREFYLPDAASETDYDLAYDLPTAAPLAQTNDHFMRRTVYGFHPGWNGTSYKAYDFGILPTVAYFGYIVDPESGGPSESYFWKTSPLMEMAHAKGSAVELVVATGSAKDNRRLLGNPTAVTNLVDSLVSYLVSRDGDGFCLDFEELPGDRASEFAAFAEQLRDSLNKVRPKAGITVTLPANDPENAFDIPALRKVADRFVVKAYSDSELPPIEASVYTNALIHYQRKGLPKQQTVLALPMWTVSKAETLPYRNFRQVTDSSAAANLPEVGQLAPLLDLAMNRGIQGIALWALGNDHGLDEVHDLVKEKYSQSETQSFGASAAKEDLGFLGPDGGATKERNQNNWMWMLGGCVFFVILLVVLKRFWKEGR